MRTRCGGKAAPGHALTLQKAGPAGAAVRQTHGAAVAPHGREAPQPPTAPPAGGARAAASAQVRGGARALRGSAERPRDPAVHGRPELSLPAVPDPAHLLAAAPASLRGPAAGAAPPPRPAPPRPSARAAPRAGGGASGRYLRLRGGKDYTDRHASRAGAACASGRHRGAASGSACRGASREP